MAAITAAGLLVGWNSTLLGPAAEAQQTPDSWTAERRAVLPSGLGIQFDFAPSPASPSGPPPESSPPAAPDTRTDCAAATPPPASNSAWNAR
ncbi:hypothetical protein ACFQ0T_21365 [Kitasatospora gansuensis]